LEVKGKGVLDITIGDQLRTVEYYSEGTKVHLFDSQGDSIGFDF
jgi:hypothetical protein